MSTSVHKILFASWLINEDFFLFFGLKNILLVKQVLVMNKALSLFYVFVYSSFV